MSYYKHAHALILLLFLGFYSPAGIAQTADESLARSVATSFFETYQRKDVDGLSALWSAKAPERETFTTDVRQTFSLVGSIELKSLEIRRITVEGTSAIVGTRVEIHATDLKSGQPTTGFGQLNRTLRLVKEDGNWKVSQYEPSERELATRLLATKTESDQTALLEAEPDLITLELVQALRKHTETLTQRRELLQADIAVRLTRSIAERIGDEQGVAFAINYRGVIHYSRGEYPQALEFFEQYLSLPPVKRDRAITARTLNNIGIIKRFFGDNVAALDYVQQSQRLAEEVGDKKILSNALNNIGLTYYRHQDYPRALEYYHRAWHCASS